MTNNQTVPSASTPKDVDPTRDEIIARRKERRKVKQLEKKRIREEEELKKKLYKKSDKLQIIDPKTLEKFQAKDDIPKPAKIKTKKQKTEEFNLLDYIIERKKQERPLKRFGAVSKGITADKTQKLRGKKRDGPRKKHHTRLKRVILKSRELKRGEGVDPQADEEQVKHEAPNHKNLEDDTLRVNQDDSSELVESLQRLQLQNVHSRRFRPYCDNTTSKRLCELTECLIKDLFRFQKRAYEKNEIKGRAHRRFVVGFKEVRSKLEIDKVKLAIIAPDCEDCELDGGLNDTINDMKEKCKEKGVPYLFSLKRRQLGYLLFKKVPVSCLGILNYDGVQDVFRQLIECLADERENYLNLFCNKEKGES